MCDKINLKIKSFEELLLFDQDILRWNSSVSNLVRHYLGVQREDVFIFRCQIHGCHPDAMNMLIHQHSAKLSYSYYVLVEDLCCQKVGPVAALEAGANLHHPVHHLGAVFLGHLVPHNWDGHSTQGLVLPR